MMKGLWGKKIGMTQVFVKDKAIPVTAIDMSNWVVTNVKTIERDGYNAVQMGRIKKKYSDQLFVAEWGKNTRKYFEILREVPVTQELQELTIGQPVIFSDVLQENEKVDVFGITKGCGFAGVMKRHGFSGGPASHGSMFKRRPGSGSFMRRQGRLIKGKRLPGHMGTQRRMIKQLAVIKIAKDAHIILVKGSVPGKAGSLVFIRKAQ